MQRSHNAFTLVELIVVISILSILATLAFVSLQGYSQDAKNSKVGYDLLNVSTLIETKLTKGQIPLIEIVNTPLLNNSVDNGVRTFASYSSDTGTGVTIDQTASTGNYGVGTINFILLQQDDTDFIDPEGEEYLVAYATAGDVAYYQVGGQVKLIDGDYESIIKGNYLDEGGINDADGLISVASGAITTGLGNAVILADTLNLY